MDFGKLLRPLALAVRMLISRAVVQRVDDSGGLQRLQIGIYADETRTDVERLQSYGFTARPLDGAEAVVARLGGRSDQAVVIAVDDRRYRVRGLEAGEVAIYSDEGDQIVLRRGRSIEVASGGSVTVSAPEVAVVASTRVTIDSPATEVTGTLEVTGSISGASLAVTGGISGASVDSAGDVTAGPANLSLLTHLHPVTSAPGVTEPGQPP